MNSQIRPYITLSMQEAQQAYLNSMFDECWASIADVGPALIQHRILIKSRINIEKRNESRIICISGESIAKD